MTWMEAAKTWAIQEIPREACGLVIVEKGREVFVPCRNISDLPDNSFTIDPKDFAEAEDRGEIIRIFHSHCYSSPRPSEPDKVSCETSGLPWSIISVPNEDWFHFEPAGYKAPLVGRSWAHGTLDCYSLIRDYYLEILNIEIPDFERRHEWWIKGENLYLENFEKAGFYTIAEKDIHQHDVVLMQIMSPVINHGAIFLGDDKILHHIHKRLSSREVFGGYYKKHAVKILRHKDANY
jgi:proteasome lid subunit RPN8/RPN11